MKTVKVVINVCYGGFGLSDAAMKRYFEILGKPFWVTTDKYNSKTYWLVPPEEQVEDVGSDLYKLPMEEKVKYNEMYSNQTISHYDIDRDDPVLVQVVEELGKESFGDYATLKVVEIPKGVSWHIEEYDGLEHVAEQHRIWE